MSQKLEVGFAIDLEGTMVNLETEGHNAAALRAAEIVGVRLTLEEALHSYPRLFIVSSAERYQLIYELSNKTLSPEEIRGLKGELFNEWLQETNIIPTRPGLFECLEEINRRDIKMMIGTSTETHLTLYYIEKSGLGEWFPRNRIIVADDVGGNNKPKPHIYIATAHKMGITTDCQLIVEDNIIGTQAGVAAGSKVIGLPVYYLPETIKVLYDAGARLVYREWPEVDLDYLLRL